MTALQLSFKFQNKQDEKTILNTSLPQTIKKGTNKNHQNTVNSCEFTNLEKIKNLNYVLIAEKHINHSKENNRSDLAKKLNNPKDELKEIIEELKKAEEKRKKAEKILRETLNDIIPKT
jgi:hypothetical protein